MALLPIIKDCRALIINDPDNKGEVVVGERCGHFVPLEGEWVGIISPRSPIWRVDRDLVVRHVETKVKYHYPYCPEHRLMRIDGFENKQASKSKIVERVMS